MTRTSVGRPARGPSPGRRPTMSRASGTRTRGAQRSASPHVDDADNFFDDAVTCCVTQTKTYVVRIRVLVR
eukprot:5910083-Prymnesium_polylepis.1